MANSGTKLLLLINSISPTRLYCTAGNGLAPAKGQLGVGNAQQAADVLLAALAQGQQLQVGVGLLAGLHALGAPDFQLVQHRSHGALAPARHVGHAEHDRLGRVALLHIEIDQLFHLAVGQRAAKTGLRAVAQAGYFSLIGCTVLVVMNILLIPRYSYMACAWAGFCGYGIAMLLSYFVGQKKYPIQYDLKAIGSYVLLAAVLYLAAEYVPIENIYLRMVYRTVLLLVFVAYIVRRDMPLGSIPVISWLIKK